MKESLKRYRRNHPELMREIRNRSYYKHKEERLEKMKETREKTRIEVLNHYGNGRCEICGESHIECLTLDHIDGGGTKWRKEHKKAGCRFYAWLKREGFPDLNLRVLCWNCNCSIGAYGYSPYEERKNEKN